MRFQNGSLTGLLAEDGRLMKADAQQTLIGEYLDVPVMTVQPSVEFADGDQVLTSDELALVTLLLRELDGSTPYRLRPKSIVYRIESRELRVSFFGVSYFIKLSTEQEGRGQVGALIASLKEFSEQGVTPQEYVDVRVDGRVFVK